MCEYARACPVHVRVAMMCLLSVVDTYLMHAILYWLITFLLYKHSMGFRPDPSLPARVGYARLIYLYYMTSIQSCFQCFCRVAQVHPMSLTFTNMQQPTFLKVLSDLSDQWKLWLADCAVLGHSAGIFQVTSSGGVGNSSTSCIVIGPFTTR